jgi:hypothetical protein
VGLTICIWNDHGASSTIFLLSNWTRDSIVYVSLLPLEEML